MLFGSACHYRTICTPRVVRHTTTQRRGRISRQRPIIQSKQYVPSDSFGGQSPERRASRALCNLFTFIAVRIILSQLEGSGRGALASYNQQQYDALNKFVQEEPLKDADAWLAKLMRHDAMLALRVMEVRAAYCNEDFEWDNLQKLAKAQLQESNVKLMRHFATASLKASAQEPPAGEEPSTPPADNDSQ